MEQNYNYYDAQPEVKKGSVITGAIGALIGALLGAVVWAVVAVFLEIISGLIGLLIGFLASKGYDLLKGRQGVVKLVCVIIAIIIGVVVGTGASYAWILHNSYEEAIAEMNVLDRALARSEAEFFQAVLKDGEIRGEILKNLAMGLFFAALGCIDLIRDITGKKQTAAAAPTTDVSAAQVPSQPAAPNSNLDDSSSL